MDEKLRTQGGKSVISNYLANPQQIARLSSRYRQLVIAKAATHTSPSPRENGTAIRFPCRKEISVKLEVLLLPTRKVG